MGLSPERAGSAIRFSLGKETTTEEIEQTIGALDRIAQRRKSSLRIDSDEHAFV
jgi:cysteine sulfinate desulfinase/cysteine desulfurase-like protein